MLGANLKSEALRAPGIRLAPANRRGREASSYPDWPTRKLAVVDLLHTSFYCVAKGAEAWET